MKHLSGDIPRAVRAKKEHRLGDIIDFSELAEGDLPQELPATVRRHAAMDVGVDQPGGDRIDGNSPGRQLARGHFRQRDYPRLARGIISLTEEADLPGNRR